ncbi:MAG TPA: Uma2 family endonuclease, partial [Jatrophihabitans sp.]|nr:Uma2 family endonuclease [Jatrophihabitans sp.]
LVVVHRAGLDRAERSGGLLTARDVVVVVEIVSPGSRRMDTVVKRGEYADAGIPHYWIIDLEPPVSLLACRLAGAFGYQDPGEVVNVYETAEPFAIRIDLASLG